MSKKIIICLEDSHLGQQRQLLDALLRQVMSTPYTGVAGYVMLSDSPTDQRLWERLQGRARAERGVTAESPSPPPETLVDALDRQLGQAKFMRGSVSIVVAGGEVAPPTIENQVLEDAARSAMRQSDELHWWGESRLCLVLPNCAGREAIAVGNRVLAEVQRLKTAARILFGAAWYPYDALKAGSLLTIAAERMDRQAPVPLSHRAP